MAASIRRQFSPCFDRIAKPGPGAERIVLTVRLRYNRDGSLAAAPEMVGGPAGVDDSNRRYVGAVVDGANTAFRDCSPLRGMPPELYDGQNGWNHFSLRYKLPG
ncbi:hypothetical protein NDN01_18915 [Sphingomonas sp. QA11]|uniref:hypothetical protein n=1 Tax=Sphingomonas sp. QA11 TaxID=2950605 RepID=UPI0023493041|nr:hypothetical protein [Sphingomonas sp. QA11]WCM26066.1 hypothetical protein NDN01_18915 [Sphingomonas sp. QA11]